IPHSNGETSFWTRWRCTSTAVLPVRLTRSAGHCSMSSTSLDLSRYHSRLQDVDTLAEFGVVEKIVGSSIESQGPNATVGSLCWLSNGERSFPVEVVGFTGGKVITMPLGKIDGVRQGDILRVSGRTASISMSE